MSAIKSFRRAVTNIKATFKAIPVIISEIKKDAEKELLRQKFHSACDMVIETYGDTAVTICKTVDVDMLTSAAFDFIALIEKWREPIQQEGQKILAALTPILEEYNKKGNKFGGEITKILNNMEKRNNWEERFTPESEKEETIKTYVKSEWRASEKARNAIEKLEETGVKLNSIKITELQDAFESEYKTWVIRKEGESTNDHWKRVQKDYTSKVKATNYLEPKA